MTPKVSIIMPVLNGEKYIQEAIESIIAQSYKDYELVVIDDGSTDQTYAKVKPYEERMELKYVRHPVCRGVPVSMNDGLRAASGQYITFLDHDDAWMPDMLETQVAYLERHEDVAMVHGDFQIIDSFGAIIQESAAAYEGTPRPSGQVFHQLFMDNFIVGTSVLIRRECFEKLGCFDESLRFGDYHMWLRIARNYKIDYNNKVVTKYRQHATQSTRHGSPSQLPPDPVACAVVSSILQLYPEIREELGKRTINRRFASLYFTVAYSCFSQNNLASARVFITKAIRACPSNFKLYGYWIVSFLRPSEVRSLKKIVEKVRLLAGKSRDQLDQPAAEIRS